MDSFIRPVQNLCHLQVLGNMTDAVQGILVSIPPDVDSLRNVAVMMDYIFHSPSLVSRNMQVRQRRGKKQRFTSWWRSKKLMIHMKMVSHERSKLPADRLLLNSFSCMKKIEFQIKFHWNMFLEV